MSSDNKFSKKIEKITLETYKNCASIQIGTLDLGALETEDFQRKTEDGRISHPVLVTADEALAKEGSFTKPKI